MHLTTTITTSVNSHLRYHGTIFLPLLYPSLLWTQQLFPALDNMTLTPATGHHHQRQWLLYRLIYLSARGSQIILWEHCGGIRKLEQKKKTRTNLIFQSSSASESQEKQSSLFHQNPFCAENPWKGGLGLVACISFTATSKSCQRSLMRN